MANKLLNVDELAELFAVTPKTIRSWSVEGMPVAKAGAKGRGNRSLYDLAACVGWYFSEKAFDDQRQRLAAAQAEKVEMENATRRGNLARHEDVIAFWNACIANSRARLLALPSRIAAPLPQALRAEIHEHARAIIFEALQELADYEPPKEKTE